MSTAPSPTKLPESSLRVLAHLAARMAEGYSGTFELVLQQGGVRDFKESRRWLTAELPGSETLDSLDGVPKG